MWVLPFKIGDALDLKRVFKWMAEHLPEVRILEPRELLSDFVRVNLWFNAFGEIFQIILEIPQSLQPIGMRVIPSDFALFDLFCRGFRFVSPSGPFFVGQWVGLIGFAENIDRIP